jgi:hypothetical protein
MRKIYRHEWKNWTHRRHIHRVRPGNNGIVSIDPVRKRRSEPGRLQYACGSNGAMCIVLRGKCTCAHVRMYGTARIVAVLKAKCIARLHVCTYVRTACTSFTRREPERAVRIHALMYRIARTVRSRSTYVLHVRTYRTYVSHSAVCQYRARRTRS